MLEGKTFQQQLGISNDMMQEFYEAAQSYLSDGQYQEASDCFLFLLVLNPLESTLWIQSGHASRFLGDPNEALQAYSMAMFSDPDDPFPHYWAALVYIDQKQYEQARCCREICLRLIDEQSAYMPLKELAQALTIEGTK